jgi:SAM-dependent methyltransferase
MPDRIFDDPRLAAVYDPLDADRRDLDVYAAMASEFGARSVLDIGCGTGTFACLLAGQGLDVVGIDPAEAMLTVARNKRGADRVRWLQGVADDLPDLQVDLVTMTGNVAQVFLDDVGWRVTLAAAHRVLQTDGRLVFETRRPEHRAWLEWNREQSHQLVDIDGVGIVEMWNEVTTADLPFVTFRGTIIFHDDNTVLTSESTLRFRSKDEIVESLVETDYALDEIRDAPDRPGKEFVVIARPRTRP